MDDSIASLQLVQLVGGSGSSALSIALAHELNKHGRTLLVTSPVIEGAFSPETTGSSSAMAVFSNKDDFVLKMQAERKDTAGFRYLVDDATAGDLISDKLVFDWNGQSGVKMFDDRFVIGMIRNDYLSLKTAVNADLAVDMYVALVDADRALNLNDCRSVLRKPVVGWDRTASIAKTLDAGLVDRFYGKVDPTVQEVLKHWSRLRNVVSPFWNDTEAEVEGEPDSMKWLDIGYRTRKDEV